MRFILKESSLAIFLCLIVASCAPRIDQRGRFLEAEKIHTIHPQMHNTQDVQHILGSPTTIGTFGEPVWVYTGVETETSAFFAPNVNEFYQVQVTFDANGFVQKVEQLFDGKAPKEIFLTPASEKTEVRGHKQGFLQQMFGNFGRLGRGGSREN